MGLFRKPAGTVVRGSSGAATGVTGVPSATYRPGTSTFTNDMTTAAALGGSAGLGAAAGTTATTAPVGQAGPGFRAAEGLEKIGGTAAGTLGLADWIIPGGLAVGAAAERGGRWLFKKSGPGRLQELKEKHLPKLTKEQLEKLTPEQIEAGVGRTEFQQGLHKATRYAWVAGSALSTYGVAKSYSQQMNSLKHMYADITGTPFEHVSTTTILVGKMPNKMLDDARKHLVMEHLVRGTIQAVGLGILIRSVRRGREMSLMEGMMPVLADQVADGVLGQSVMPIYAGISNAYNSGQPLPPEIYQEFLLQSSPVLANRGEVGKLMAEKLGQQYASGHVAPAVILREMNTKVSADSNKTIFQARIESVLEAAETEHAERVAARKQAAAEAAARKQEAAAHKQDHHGKGKHVARLEHGKHAEHRATLGHHTSKVNAENPHASPERS